MRTIPETEPESVTITHIARAHGVCVRTVGNWMRRGVIPYWKIGKVIRFNPGKVRAALERWTETMEQND